MMETVFCVGKEICGLRTLALSLKGRGWDVEMARRLD